jgi:hypothetical protein
MKRDRTLWSTSLLDFITAQLSDADAQWSLGTFGAVAEFMRSPDEQAISARSENVASAVTARGAISISAAPGLRPIAFETITTQAWSQRVAFCLPEEQCRMNGRSALTELGPDDQALRPEDRGAVLFDLGLDLLQVDACVRTSDTDLLKALRAGTGRSLFEPNNLAMGAILAASPHRVFLTRCGRVEVYQPIPRHGTTSPEGPHTHVLPNLLRHRRTHGATEPIPSGWVSCAHLYPAHPLHDGFGRGRPFDQVFYDSFQQMLAAYGQPLHIALKHSVLDAISAGRGPSAIVLPRDRHARSLVRITLRQAKALNSMSSSMTDWLAAYENVREIDAKDARTSGEHACRMQRNSPLPA